MPEQPHPNCTCTCDVIGSDEKIKPRPKKPKKGNCAKKTSDYGKRTHPTTGELGKMHHGPDFSAPEDININFPVAGDVIVSKVQDANNLSTVTDRYFVTVKLSENTCVKFGHLKN